MGKLLIQQYTTLDRYAADADGGLGFIDRRFDSEAIDDETHKVLEECSGILLGRRTYEMFEAYWPGADPAEEPLAAPINILPKYVVTSTLDRAPWGNGEATVLPADPAAIHALKDASEGDIIVWGSLRLTSLLFGAHLVDELLFHTLPVILGAGRPALPPEALGAHLTLLGVSQLGTGDVFTRYAVW